MIEEIEELLKAYIEYDTFTWDLSKPLKNLINKESKFTLSPRSHQSITPYSFLGLKNKDSEEKLLINFQELKEPVIAKSRKYKTENLLKLLIFIQSLPMPTKQRELLENSFLQNMNDDQKKDLAEMFFKKLAMTDLTHLTVGSDEPQAIREWESLGRKSSVFDIFDPIPKVLSALITNPYKGLLWEMINNLKPIFFIHPILSSGRSALLLNKDKDIICAELKTKKQKLRITYLLKNLNTESLETISENLVKHLIQKEWRECGRIIMQKKFGNTHNYNESFDFNILERVTYNTLKTGSTDLSALFDSFVWPEDWQAYAGFLLQVDKRNDSREYTDDKIEPILSQALYDQWNSFKPTQEYFDGHQNFLGIGIYDILHPKSRFAMGLAIAAILSNSSTQEEKWFRWLKGLLLSIKPYLYSSGAQYAAKEMITEIILLHASSAGLDASSKTFQLKMKKNLKLIQDIILYPYINLMEKNDDIWNPRRIYSLQNFTDEKTNLMNFYLKNIFDQKESDHFRVFKNFLKKWQEWANVEWYWFANIENE